MVKIGQASIDENGKISGGAAGDQTGKEVYTRDWYDKGWKYLIRAKSKDMAEKMAQACEAGCANDNIGYDQNQRNTLRTAAEAAGWDLSKAGASECDCSSFMAVCAEAAGSSIPYNGSNAPTTSTMVTAFGETGDFDILSDSRYLTGTDYLERGDILVKPGSHTVMVLEDGASAGTSASSGSTGIEDFQLWLGVTADGIYGPKTKAAAIKKYQSELNTQFSAGLEVDGVWGPKTLAATVNVREGAKGNITCILQGMLYCHGYDPNGFDGIFGSGCTSAVKSFQAAQGLTADGIAGKQTWAALFS